MKNKYIKGYELVEKVYNKEITSKDKIFLINLSGERVEMYWKYGLLRFVSKENIEDKALELFDLLKYEFEVIEHSTIKEKIINKLIEIIEELKEMEEK